MSLPIDYFKAYTPIQLLGMFDIMHWNKTDITGFQEAFTTQFDKLAEHIYIDCDERTYIQRVYIGNRPIQEGDVMHLTFLPL